MHYLIFALQTVNANIAISTEAMLTADKLSTSSLIVTIINDLLTYAEPVLVVLDDYHLLANQEVHDALDFFLDHQPSNVKLLMVSRSDPPFSLAKLRAKGQLLEFRAEDLRFQETEVKAFLVANKLTLEDKQ